MAKVLVVEDERDIRDMLRRFLERAGCSVLTASTGLEGMRLLEEADPDVLLLDLGLPDLDGLELLCAAFPGTPVVVLTARSDTHDRIEGLRLGADDYVVKPFSPTEVVLRVKAVLHRTLGHAPERSSRSFGSGALQIDPSVHRATYCGRDLALTASEWELLAALADSPGRVLSRLELVNRVRGYQFEGYERTIDSHVKNLRRKLGDTEHLVIDTVIGFGYRLGLRADD
jgi:DNA-binding response OmpR family regulator